MTVIVHLASVQANNQYFNQSPKWMSERILHHSPTKYFMQCLDECIGIITMIMKVALKDVMFVPTWKMAVVRPLLKTACLDLVNSNYRQ